MAEYIVRCNASGQSFHCSEEKSLLIAMERQARTLIPVGCRGGGCGLCRIRIVSGQYQTKKMSKAFIQDEDVKQNITLACRTFPRSDVVFELATPD